MQTRIPRRQLLAALVVLPLLAACTPDTPPRTPGSSGSETSTPGGSSTSTSTADMQLEVVAQWWNGLYPEFESQPETTIVDAVVGESAVVPGMDGDVTITVREVGDDSVTIETSEQMNLLGVGIADLDTFYMTFDVGLDAPTLFGSPTLDSGYDYEVTLFTAP